jgi:hypothetical protein
MLRGKVAFGRKGLSAAGTTILAREGASNVSAQAEYSISYENESLMASVCNALRTVIDESTEMLVWRRPFRWHCDRGAIPNAYEMFSLEELADHLQMEVIHNFCHAGVLRRRAQ